MHVRLIHEIERRVIEFDLPDPQPQPGVVVEIEALFQRLGGGPRRGAVAVAPMKLLTDQRKVSA